MGQSTEELTSQIEDTRERMAGNLDTLQDRVSPSAIVERRKQAAKDRISSVKDKVMGSAQSAKDSVSSAASSASSGAAGTGSNVASTAQDQFQGAPLAAGLVAFGAGVVLASLLPASRLEAEAAHRGRAGGAHVTRLVGRVAHTVEPPCGSLGEAGRPVPAGGEE